MTDTSRFGRGAQFGDRISPAGEDWDSAHCGDCEAMLADALDGTLGPEEQQSFAAHSTACGPCTAMLADARRGAAWLEMLREPRPEPPAELLERILAQTSGTQTFGVQTSAAAAPIAEAPQRGARARFGVPFGAGFGTGFADRFRAALSRRSFAGGVMQPRLAMTAAMAFFSIALTLNLAGVRLTGVRLSEVRSSDMNPSLLRRSFYRADARVVQYYENLRWVYELESRVHDLQSEPDDSEDSPAAAPAQPGGQFPGQTPAQSPSRTPVLPQPFAAPPTHPGAAPEAGGRIPGPGSSRRENPLPGARALAVGWHSRIGISHPAVAARRGTPLEIRKVGSLV